jgi:hypothetical protein
MTTPDDNSNTELGSVPGSERPSSDELPSWMKSALGGTEDAQVDVLRGVQDRLHERSGGKFYRDGWSTARHAPFATYFITALLMAATIVLIYAIITPVIPDPLPKPQPVQILAPH